MGALREGREGDVHPQLRRHPALHGHGPDELSPGEHQIRVEFAYDGGGPGKGGTATLYVDGDEAGSVVIERTHSTLWSFDETTDVGRDTGAPVTTDYAAGDNAFHGEIRWVRLDTGDDDHSHLIPPEQHLQVAMTRQ